MIIHLSLYLLGPTVNGFFNFIQFGNNIAKSLSVVLVLRDQFKSIVPKYGRQ